MIAILLLVLFLGALAVGGLVAFTWWTKRRIEAEVPPLGRFVEVDGVRLHYVEEGAGPPIVMIHGLGSQLQTFTYALSTRLRSDHRVIMIDRPGAGYSAAAASGDLTTQAATIAGVLRELGVGSALVVGHSLGGAVALALAIDHPDRVAGLALLSPATQPQDDVPLALRGLAIRSDAMRRLLGWTLITPLNMLAGHKTIAAVFAPDPVPQDFGTRAGGLLQVRPSAFRNASRDLVEAGEQLAAYAARQRQIEVPVGVLFGRGDAILDHAQHGGGLAKAIDGVDLALIPGGHMIPISAPDQSAAFIRRIADRAFALAARTPTGP